MNEQVGESGPKQEDKNTVQALDLLVRRRQVYPKKPRYNLLTPDQLKDKKKAASVQRKEKRVAFENSLTPDQLEDKKKAANVQRKEKRVAFENSLTSDQLKDKKKAEKAVSIQRKEKRENILRSSLQIWV